MKKLPIILSIGIFIIVSPVSAQDPSSSSARNQQQIKLNNKPGNNATGGSEIINKIEIKKEESKERILAHRRERILSLYKLMQVRLHAAVERMEKIGLRVSSRLDSMSAEGIDVTSVKQKLTGIQTELMGIKTSVDLLGSQPEEIINSQTPLSAFQTNRLNVLQIKEKIIKIHKDYISLIKEIKLLLPTASSSPVKPTITVTNITTAPTGE